MPVKVAPRAADRRSPPGKRKVMDQSEALHHEASATSERPRRSHRRHTAALVALAFVFVTGASAATLGGLGGRAIGADRGVVASCDGNGVRVLYGPTTFNPALHAFTVSLVSVRGIAAACRGRTLSVTLRDAANASLASVTAPVTATRVDVTLSPAVPVSGLTGVVAAIT